MPTPALANIAPTWFHRDPRPQAVHRSTGGAGRSSARLCPDRPAVIYEFEGKREEAAPIGDRFFPVLEKAYFLRPSCRSATYRREPRLARWPHPPPGDESVRLPRDSAEQSCG